MSRTLWIIAEDENDVAILRQILLKMGLTIHIRAYPRGQTPGIGLLARSLTKWLHDIHHDARWKEGDCIAVLHDLDSTIPDHRPLVKQIQDICEREGMVRLSADDEIESWLLADGGISTFLGIKTQTWDGKTEVKQTLEALLRKKKMVYRSRDRERLIEKLDGTAVQRSPSLKQPIQNLQAADCLPKGV